jgi:hypothetical protein
MTCAQGSQCQNGATCVDQPLDNYICLCTPNWTGIFCDYPIGIVVLTFKKIFKINFKISSKPVLVIHVKMEEHA